MKYELFADASSINRYIEKLEGIPTAKTANNFDYLISYGIDTTAIHDAYLADISDAINKRLSELRAQFEAL